MTKGMKDLSILGDHVEVIMAIDVSGHDCVQLPAGPWGEERIGQLRHTGVPWESFESIDFLFEGEDEKWIRNIPRDTPILRTVPVAGRGWTLQPPEIPADDEFTLEERKAIESLERLAKKWPESLTLFSWSGSLVVLRTEDVRNQAGDDGQAQYSLNDVPSVTIRGIPNDGGDPE